MEYNCGLQVKYFNAMKKEDKNIEIRLNDEKRKQYKVGDRLVFLKEPDRIEKINTEIKKLVIFNNFIELIDNYDIKYLAPSGETKESLLNELEKYYSKEQQEKYKVLAIEVEKQEKSCGAVVVKDDKVLLVKHNLGHWGIPKGHVEEDEEEYETAIREIKEETNVDIEIKDDFRISVTYSPKLNTKKEVVFFLGSAINNNIVKQDKEIKEVKYVSFDEAIDLVKYDEVKNALLKVKEYLKK